jgi:hypothetical protein
MVNGDLRRTGRNASPWLALLACVLASAAVGCRSARTEVVVVVDTDLRTPPSALDAFRITVTAPDGTSQTSTATLGPTDLPPPRTLGLVHTTGALGPFVVRAEGLAGGTARVARDASFSFVPGETRVLWIDLLGACIGTRCGSGQTCSEGGCRAIEVAEPELLPWTGTVPTRDAGSTDTGRGDGGGLDAGRLDAGSPDAGSPDAGSPDAGRDAPVDSPDAPPCTDGDRDGFSAGPGCVGMVDCDDAAPSVFPGATEVCNEVDDDCDGTIDDGFDLDADLTNCGGCGIACDFRNATGGACDRGECVFDACNDGFDDCNRDGVDGCEVDLNTDLGNCGGCGDSCRMPDRACCAGNCERSCP